MAKTKSAGNGNRSGAVRDGSKTKKAAIEDQPQGDVIKYPFVKRVGPKILFPTEPSTIGREKIDRVIREVVARRKQQSK